MREAAARACPGPRTTAELDAFAAELSQIRADTMKRVGADDARYIIHLLWVIRACESAARLLLLTPIWLPTWWLGTALLALAKCLQNMEFGHNVMHGQYDWMNDPRVDGKTHEWDAACSKEDWRHFHNFVHHHYTNVLDVDRDFGYGMLRLSADVPWEPRYLTQAPYALVVAMFFEWAIAIHNLEAERLRTDREATLARMKALWPNVKAKMGVQFRKDYVAWPLVGAAIGVLSGAMMDGGWTTASLWQHAQSGFVGVLAGNAIANIARNLWTFVVIFCGHFPDGVYTFDAALVKGEHKGQWYLRQILGSANIKGGKLFHLLTGNLSHQIEHHLYPDVPARRYAGMAPRVREVCERHGVPYHTGHMLPQLWTVAARIVRYSLPGGARAVTLIERPQ